ncbi:MAG: cation:proton antiporter [candidate division Zixibacteria bacterium]|nr:cation:proton antiporter [candidate division Zixibacteria bacterium]
MDLPHLLVTLILIFVGAKVLGEFANRIGQPTVLGELVAGVLLGVGGLKLVDPHANVFVLLADIGVIILLFETGLATDVRELLEVGWRSLAVAAVGVILPFVGGFVFALAFGYTNLIAIFLGATLTATSVGITVRVLSDLGKLGTKEAKIILGAAVADDIIGLIILAVIRDLGMRGEVSALKTAQIATLAVGFFIAAIVVGNVFAKRLVKIIEKARTSGTLIVASIAFAFLWSLGAELAGSAAIVGSFAAGLALGRTHKFDVIARELKPVAYIFTPIFFVKIGADVDVRYFNPFNEANHAILVVGGSLFVVAIVGKVLSGLVVFDKRVNSTAVGIGMAPRGEVGLIFAEVGRRAGIVTADLFAAVVVVMALTTFIAPPLLKLSMVRRPRGMSLWAWFFEPARKRVSSLIWGR